MMYLSTTCAVQVRVKITEHAQTITKITSAGSNASAGMVSTGKSVNRLTMSAKMIHASTDTAPSPTLKGATGKTTLVRAFQEPKENTVK